MTNRPEAGRTRSFDAGGVWPARRGRPRELHRGGQGGELGGILVPVDGRLHAVLPTPRRALLTTRKDLIPPGTGVAALQDANVPVPVAVEQAAPPAPPSPEGDLFRGRRGGILPEWHGHRAGVERNKRHGPKRDGRWCHENLANRPRPSPGSMDVGRPELREPAEGDP